MAEQKNKIPGAVEKKAQNIETINQMTPKQIGGEAATNVRTLDLMAPNRVNKKTPPEKESTQK